MKNPNLLFFKNTFEVLNEKGSTGYLLLNKVGWVELSETQQFVVLSPAYETGSERHDRGRSVGRAGNLLDAPNNSD
jgi:hypothetical protein